jgi:small subunit ribosomal protein S19
MSRSLWKGLFIDPKLLKNKKQKANSKIWSRSSVIPSSLIGETVFVHNGKEFKRVSITREKIGFKFGEFSFTRRYTLKQKTQNSTVKKVKK